ncbi:hypothetical protein D3C80_568700 [compost metagenome]
MGYTLTSDGLAGRQRLPAMPCGVHEGRFADLPATRRSPVHALVQPRNRPSHSPMHLEGVLEISNATARPARLVRGLRRVALEHGAKISRTRLNWSGAWRACRAAGNKRTAHNLERRAGEQRVGGGDPLRYAAPSCQ